MCKVLSIGELLLDIHSVTANYHSITHLYLNLNISKYLVSASLLSYFHSGLPSDVKIKVRHIVDKWHTISVVLARSWTDIERTGIKGTGIGLALSIDVNLSDGAVASPGVGRNL